MPSDENVFSIKFKNVFTSDDRFVKHLITVLNFAIERDIHPESDKESLLLPFKKEFVRSFLTCNDMLDSFTDY